jgi:opacity protein-like surface antigen
MISGEINMLRKVLISGLLMLGMVGSLHAEEGGLPSSEKIIGVEIGSGKIQADTLLGGYDYVGNSATYGVRIGAQNAEWRTLLSLGYYNSSNDDQKYIKGLVSFDYLLTDSELKPYVGLNAGYLDYTSTNNDDSGFLYGGQVGILYHATDNIQIDLTYRYSFVEADRVNHVEDIVFGVNYIF